MKYIKSISTAFIMVVLSCSLAFADFRIKDKTDLSSPAGSEYLYTDSETTGVRRLSLDGYARWLTSSSAKYSDYLRIVSTYSQIDSAAAELEANGGGELITMPGTYLVTSKLTYRPTVVYNFGESTLDCSPITTGDCTAAEGSISSTPVALGANKTRGDTVLTTSTAHGLVVGDYALLKSQRAALHADGDLGDSKRLGETTVGTTSTFFAEPILVGSVDSPTQITLEKGLIFADYRTDRSLETYTSDRVSDIAKLNLVPNIKIKGGKFILGSGGATVCLRLNYTLEPEVDGTTFDLGTNEGSAIRVNNSLRHNIKNVTAKRTSGWTLVGDHASWNSFRETGAWYGRWDYTDINGCQGLDITWIAGGHPSIEPYITGKAYDPQESGVTFHSGAFGGTIENFQVHRAKYYGISQRSRYVTINNPRIVGPMPNTGNTTGILLTGWAVDGSINNAYIDGGGGIDDVGAQYGIRLNREGAVAVGPVARNITISNPIIKDCDTSIYLLNDTSNKTADPSGIIIRNAKISGAKSFGILIEPYINYVDIDGLDISALRGSGTPKAIYSMADSIGTRIRNVLAKDIGAASILVNVMTITDTTTFPPATYPTARFNIDWKSIMLLGTGIYTVEAGGTVGGMKNVQALDYTFTIFDTDRTVYSSESTALAKTWTVPPDADVPFPRNTVITGIQLGTGQITIAPGAGVTLESVNGLKISGQYGVVKLQKRTANSWVVSGNTTP